MGKFGASLHAFLRNFYGLFDILENYADSRHPTR